jgi:hypothetical protein
MEMELLRKDKELEHEKHKIKCNSIIAKFEKDMDKTARATANTIADFKTQITTLEEQLVAQKAHCERARDFRDYIINRPDRAQYFTALQGYQAVGDYASAHALQLSAEANYTDPNWAAINLNPYMPGALAPPPGIVQTATPPVDKWVGKYMDPAKWFDTNRLNDGLQMWRHTVVSPDDDWAQSPYWDGVPYYLVSDPTVRCYKNNIITTATSAQLQDEEQKHATRRANAKRRREDQAKRTAAEKLKKKAVDAPNAVKPAKAVKKRPMTGAMKAARQKASKANTAHPGSTATSSSSSSSSSSSTQAPTEAAVTTAPNPCTLPAPPRTEAPPHLESV